MMMSATIAEREAELAALQSAFDEYITSSRELEEELDTELAKMQEKLAESSAANAALSAQLENIAPQLGSLEKALTETRHKLEQEQKQRRHAEQLQDEAEARCREAEGTLAALKEDCDAAHEELAFKESELEETRLELDVEQERHRVEMEELQLELQARHTKQDEKKEENDEEDDMLASATKQEEEADYVKRLEDELELVTEQLIETEQRLTVAEDALKTLRETSEVTDKALTLSQAQEEELKTLRDEHAANLEQLQNIKDELELAQEELTLTQDELRAAEEEVQTYNSKIEKLRIDHKAEITSLKADLEMVQGECRTLKGGMEVIENALTKSATESETLRVETENLSKALSNAKADHHAALEELEELMSRFDEAKKEAERAGRESAKEEVKASMAAEREAEVSKFKAEIQDLQALTTNLQQKLDDAETALASANEAGQKFDEEQSETVKKLQEQLMRTRDELQKKEQDVRDFKEALEARVTKAEEDVAKLEKELSLTKGKLYEAEANLIVSAKREKTRAAAAPPPPPPPSYKNSSQDHETLSPHGESHALSRSIGEDGEKRPRSVSPTTEQRLHIRAEEEASNAADLKKLVIQLKEQVRMSEKHSQRLEDELKGLQKQLFAGDGGEPVVSSMSRLSQITNSNPTLLEDEASSKIESIIASRDTKAMTSELRNLDRKYTAQREYNAQLLSKILSLQGNIQVCCRVRPLRMDEREAGAKNNVEALSETELGCFDARNSKWKSFTFDKVWGPDQSQQTIFQDVEPLALSVVDGYNACIFAYGQTGSGKTYTMEGITDNNNYGISYRTIQKLFTLLNLRKHQQKAAAALGADSKEFTFKLQLGMLEIYNDEIFDLLAPHSSAGSKADQKQAAKKAGTKATLDIRRSEDGKIEVPDLTKQPVNSIDDVMRLLAKGNTHRATASTNLNEHSSRSHMVLHVDVESGLEGEPSNKGILYLVDLAGSERVRKSAVEGEQLKEATHINKSLSALGNVMEALDRKASHIPYRDSKLTYLLQDSLGGNSRTMMVVAVCPADTAYDESVHALQFATRVRRIQIGAAKRNVTSKNLEETIKALTSEVKQLSKAKEKSESQLSSLKKDNTRIQEKLQTISAKRSESQSDNKTLELLRKNNNDMAARWNKEKSLRERQAEELEKSKTELRKKQTEIANLTREKESIQRKLEEKQLELSRAAKDVREAKDKSSAANLRARKAQIIGSRNTPVRSVPSPSVKQAPMNEDDSKESSPPPSSKVDIEEVRQEVLELLEKYDQAKVDRIDIIMDKFKGKENLLVDKMRQRYEGAGAVSSASVSLQRRSEQALQRHKDRMHKRLEEQKAGN